jgi:hypothetical protein
MLFYLTGIMKLFASFRAIYGLNEPVRLKNTVRFTTDRIIVL